MGTGIGEVEVRVVVTGRKGSGGDGGRGGDSG